MEIDLIEEKLAKLRTKQKMVDEAWNKTGNQALLEFFVDLVPRALDAQRCSIFVLDPQADKVWLKCGTGMSERDIEVPKSSSLVGKVVATGKPIISMSMDKQAGAHSFVDQVTGFDTVSAIVVPIFGFEKQKDKATGAIQVLNKRNRKEFNQEDQDILERLAFHLQMHIENIYLRQELSKISKEMSDRIHKYERLLIQSKIKK